jgi:hypothetical protein
MNKIREIINKILSTKVGKFLFEFTNMVALIFLTIYMFAHVEIVFGIIALFCAFSNALVLVDKYFIKNKNKIE